jgi:hypothetical protein
VPGIYDEVERPERVTRTRADEPTAKAFELEADGLARGVPAARDGSPAGQGLRAVPVATEAEPDQEARWPSSTGRPPDPAVGPAGRGALAPRAPPAMRLVFAGTPVFAERSARRRSIAGRARDRAGAHPARQAGRTRHASSSSSRSSQWATGARPRGLAAAHAARSPRPIRAAARRPAPTR